MGKRGITRLVSALPIAVMVVPLLACPSRPESRSPLPEANVVSFAPKNVTWRAQEPIEIMFDRPIVAEEQVGKRVTQPLISLEPEVPHVVHWRDRQTLVLTHTEPLRPGTRYQVELRSTFPARLARDQRSHSFVHLPLELQGLVGADPQWFPPSQSVGLRFNLPVLSSEAVEHCRLRAGQGGGELELRAENPSQAGTVVNVAAARPLPQGGAYELVCQGLVPEGGNEPTASAPMSIRVYPAAAIEEVSPAASRDVPPDELEVVVTTTTPVDLDEIRRNIRITPAVPGFAEGWVSRTPTRFVRVVTLEAATDYTLEVVPGLVDRFGQRLTQAHRTDFHTSDATPRLFMERGIYAIESASAGYPVWSRNVREFEVECAAVPPQRIPQLLTTTMDYDPWYSASQRETIPWQKLGLQPSTFRVTVPRVLNRWHLNDINLPAQCGGRGGRAGGLYLAEFRSEEVVQARRDQDWWLYPYRLLGNVTDLGLLLKAGPSSGLVWVAKISDGTPVGGASVVVYDPRGRRVFQGLTDNDGILRLPGTSELLRQRGTGDSQAYTDQDEWYDIDSYRQQRMIVVVEKGGDLAVVDGNWANGIQIWNFGLRPDTQTGGRTAMRGFILSDRGIYRPGETVHFKGFVRELAPGQPPRRPAARQVTLYLEDPTGTQLSRREVALTEFGGFSFDAPLSSDALLGDYRVRAVIGTHAFRESFTVQDFRPVPFEITERSSGEQRRPGTPLTLRFNASYLFGAPVANASVEWSVNRRRRHIRFDEYPSFFFEDWSEVDHWSFWDGEDEELGSSSSVFVTGGNARTNGSGDFTVEFRDEAENLRGTRDYLVQVTVTDPTEQQVSKRTVLTLHPTDRYLGLHTQEFVQAVRMPFAVQAVAVTPDGHRATMEARLSLAKNIRRCDRPQGPWAYQSCRDEPQAVWTRNVSLSAGGVSTERVEIAEPGEYLIRLEGQDSEGRPVATASMVWVLGEGEAFWSGDESARMALIASKDSYVPGETAHLAARAPIGGATALITVERDGVIGARVERLPEGLPRIDVPLDDAAAPNVFVSVAAIRGRTGEGEEHRPFFALGLTNLKVSAERKRLQVHITTEREEYRPGDTVTGVIQVASEGQPVRAEVSLSVANEGVLQLVNYQTPDPMASFYRPWGLGVENSTTWNRIVRRRGPTGWEDEDQPGDTGSSGSRIRSRFVSSAFWAPILLTDQEGQVAFSFEAPDNLTAFRLMAAAADQGDRFGSADRRIRVRKDLVVLPVLPRFFNEGDRIEIGAVVHNYTDQPGQARVAVAAKGLSERSWEKTVQVSPNGSQRLSFWTSVPSGPTEAELTLTARLGTHSDGLTQGVPVRRPLLFDHQSLLDGALAQAGSVEAPLTWSAPTLPSESRLHVTVDPTGLAQLEPSLRYLVTYPHGCLEQTLSQVIPLCSVQDLATSLQLQSLKNQARLQTFLALGIGKIIRHQHADGHFSLWPSTQTEPYLTAYALFGLSRAKQAGIWIRRQPLKRGLKALKSWANGVRPAAGAETDTMAWAAFVLATWNEPDSGLNARLYEQRAALSSSGKSLLLRALATAQGPADQVASLVTDLEQAATREGTRALIRQTGDRRAWYDTDTRATALALSALLEARPGHELIPALAEGLRGIRGSSGAWATTHDNLYALVGLADFARQQAQRSASVTLKLGDQVLERGAVRGGKVWSFNKRLSKLEPGTLRLEATGPVHYSASVELARAPSASDVLSNGFEITREYLDFASGVPLSKARVGDLIRVRVTVTAREAREHVALVDPIPSGCEIVNTSLATEAVPSSGARPPQGGSGSWQWRHQELHDDRATAFAPQLTGQARFEYILRAMQRGRFAVPPAQVEAMYAPQYAGRTDGFQLTVQ